MQTFLPYPDFVESARVLDWRRLGKQRVEAQQLLRAITARAGGWQAHPAARMWQGYAHALAVYGQIMVNEWTRRGYRTSMSFRLAEAAELAVLAVVMPPWVGSPEFHAAHRSALLRKDPGWYGQFGWAEAPGLPYVWPVGG